MNDFTTLRFAPDTRVLKELREKNALLERKNKRLSNVVGVLAAIALVSFVAAWNEWSKVKEKKEDEADADAH
jgi:hypothetical protein